RLVDLWDALIVVNDARSSYRSDELRFEDFFASCFYFYPVDYQGGQILYKNLFDLGDDFETVGNGKGKVVLDDFEAVGNEKGNVLLDDSKHGLILTKSFGDPTAYGAEENDLGLGDVVGSGERSGK
nr:hypothetical protein [Tanacetum cinerariifolium]